MGTLTGAREQIGGRVAPVPANRSAARAWLWTTVVLTVGAFIAAVVLAPPASAPPPRGLAWLLFLGSSVHVASTGWLYTLSDVRVYVARRPFRYRFVPIGLVLLSAAVAAAVSPSDVAWLLLPYFAWQFFHFQKQNLGMVALVVSSRGLTALSPAERWALKLTGGAGIAGLMAHPVLLQLKVDPGFGVLFFVAGVAFAGAVLAGLAALLRRPQVDRPAAFCVVYLLALLFSLPVFAFGSPYEAVGGMTIAHGLQYLLLIGLVAAGHVRRTSRMLSLAVFSNFALLGGLALNVASHLHGAAPAGRLLFGGYLGATMAHFVIDAGFWRLRDPFPRAFMARHLPYLVRPAQALRYRLPIDRQAN